MGWGPSSVTLRFYEGGQVELSRNTLAATYGNTKESSNGLVVPGSTSIPADYWAYRKVSSDKAP
jgi:hypothetical protein